MGREPCGALGPGAPRLLPSHPAGGSTARKVSAEKPWSGSAGGGHKLPQESGLRAFGKAKGEVEVDRKQ